MNHSPLLLGFTPRTMNDLDNYSVQHTCQYDTLKLDYAKEGITFNCVLPYDAQIGDVISLSATKPDARAESFSAETTLTKADLENKNATLKLIGDGETDDYLMQLNLLGLHGSIKNSAEFNAHIKSQAIKNKKMNTISPWLISAKKQGAKLMSVMLSAF